MYDGIIYEDFLKMDIGNKVVPTILHKWCYSLWMINYLFREVPFLVIALTFQMLLTFFSRKDARARRE